MAFNESIIYIILAQAKEKKRKKYNWRKDEEKPPNASLKNEVETQKKTVADVTKHDLWKYRLNFKLMQNLWVCFHNLRVGRTFSTKGKNVIVFLSLSLCWHAHFLSVNDKENWQTNNEIQKE